VERKGKGKRIGGRDGDVRQICASAAREAEDGDHEEDKGRGDGARGDAVAA
jgi:hypothetical protein